jgi:hypothetical protein
MTRRPVRFFVHEIAMEGTLWLEESDGERGEVLSVTPFDSMGHGNYHDRKLRVVIMQTGPEVRP